jgi:hypothetical protein
MIVDCHTQVWDTLDWMGRVAVTDGRRPVQADTARHSEAIAPVDFALVYGFKSRHLNAEIPNDFVASYVQRSSKLIGFAGLDPTDTRCLEDLRIAAEDLHLKGVTVSPPMQNFHPVDTQVVRVYEQCALRKLPVVFDLDHRTPAARMEFARPLLVDEVAREFPDLKIVITHLGYPWVDETVAVLARHKHVHADISGLLRRPWLAYNALLTSYEYGVMDKLLFGSNFPYSTPAACIEALYTVNQVSYGTNLVPIPREQLRAIVERDALDLLGIERERASVRKSSTILSDED